MSNDFLVERKGPDVIITVNGKTVTILRKNLADLCMVKTIGPFIQKLKESILGPPSEMEALYDFLNDSNSEQHHNMMDEIMKYC